MPAIGITGGIATGKTTFCQKVGEVLPRARFFNADRAARLLVDRDETVQQEIRQQFGMDIYSTAGDLNRAQLRAIILESADKRGALEQILHPRIRREWSAEAEKHRNSPDFFFADIPLLYETGGEPLCDRVVVVACSRDTQIERLVARGGIRAEAMKLIEAQMPLGEKITRADHVVWNNNGQEVLLGQAKRLVGVWRSESWTKK